MTTKAENSFSRLIGFPVGRRGLQSKKIKFINDLGRFQFGLDLLENTWLPDGPFLPKMIQSSRLRNVKDCSSHEHIVL